MSWVHMRVMRSGPDEDPCTIESTMLINSAYVKDMIQERRGGVRLRMQGGTQWYVGILLGEYATVPMGWRTREDQHA